VTDLTLVQNSCSSSTRSIPNPANTDVCSGLTRSPCRVVPSNEFALSTRARHHRISRTRPALPIGRRLSGHARPGPQTSLSQIHPTLSGQILTPASSPLYVHSMRRGLHTRGPGRPSPSIMHRHCIVGLCSRSSEEARGLHAKMARVPVPSPDGAPAPSVTFPHLAAGPPHGAPDES
jgi:hypothetical protein